MNSVDEECPDVFLSPSEVERISAIVQLVGRRQDGPLQFRFDPTALNSSLPPNYIHNLRMSVFRLSTRALAAPLRLASRQPQAFRPLPIAAWRSYSASALSADAITARITDVLHSFEKVDPSKVRSYAFALFARLPSRVGGAADEISGGRRRIGTCGTPG